MKILTSTSDIRLLLPFRFDPEGFEPYSQWVSGPEVSLDHLCAEPGADPHLVFDETGFDTEGLLPHIADYLRLGVAKPTARRWRARNTGPDNPRRRVLFLGDLTIRRGGKPEPPVRFEIRSLDVILFRSGVGFVTTKVRPDSPDPNVWLDAQHYLRYANASHVQFACADTAAVADPEADRKPVSLYELLSGLLDNFAPGAEQWWHEVFVSGRLLTFSFVQAEESTDDTAAFEYLHRLRKGHHARHSRGLAPEQARLDHPSLLPYIARHWFFFGLEGGGLFGIDPPDTPGAASQLAGDIGRTYYFAFLLAQFQRFALVALERSVAESWLEDDDRERMHRFDLIRGRLLEFTARGYCSQAMQRDTPHRCYRKWQEVCETENLYHEVAAEVRELYDDLQLQSSRRAEAHALRLNDIAIVFTVVSLVVAIVAAVNDTFPDGAKLTTFAILAFSGAALVGALLLGLALRYRRPAPRTAITSRTTLELGEGRKPERFERTVDRVPVETTVDD